jgi:hypothetical protein
MTWYIYLLIDPRDGEIRYVGGSKSPKTRYQVHVTESVNTPKFRWVQELRARRMKPIMEILIEYQDEKEMVEDEIAWVRRLRAAGCPLFNHNRRRALSTRHPLWGAVRREQYPGQNYFWAHNPNIKRAERNARKF